MEESTVSGTNTNLTRRYLYGLSLISQTTTNSGSTTTLFFVTDGHGSARLLLDTSGTVSNAFAFDAYGTLVASNVTAQTEFLYNEERLDSTIASHYLRARYLNPNTGRFWTMDTSEGGQEQLPTLHKYAFGADNPVDNSDPSGNDIVTDIGGILDTLDSFVNSAELVYKQALTVRYRQRALNLLTTVIRPTLNAIQSESGTKLAGENAEYMLLGTAIAESGDVDTRKQRGGPALGLFQMESFTYNDLFKTTLSKPNRKSLQGAILKHCGLTQAQSQVPDVQLLVSDESYATIMARVRYLPANDPIPSATDLKGQAQYWVEYYNRGGKGTVADYLARWHAALAPTIAKM